MPEKKEKQDKSKRDIVNRDSMTGAMKKALSGVSDTMNSPLLPERPGLDENSIFNKSLGFDVPMFGGKVNVGIPSMAEMYDNIRGASSPMNMAALAMMTRPTGNLQRIGDNLKQNEQIPFSSAELPPEMVAPGMEAEYNMPRGAKPAPSLDQKIYDMYRSKHNMGQDLPTEPISVNPSMWWTNRRSYGN